MGHQSDRADRSGTGAQPGGVTPAVLIVFHGAWPQVRLRRFAHACRQIGWDIEVICSRIAWERGLHDLDRVHARCVSASPTPWSPGWARALRTATRQRRFNLAIVREAVLAPICVRMLKESGVPMLLDIADDYPGCFAVWRQTEGLSGFIKGNWRKSPVLMGWLERLALTHAEAITCVCEESRNRLVARGAGAPTHVVPNVPMLDDFPIPLMDQMRAPRSVVFPGELHPIRGVRVLMQACAYAGWRSLVIGEGKQSQSLLRDRSKVTSIVGQLPYRQMLEAANTCQIGAVPHLDNRITRTTVPNKLFEMMALGLPVVCSDLPPLSRIMRATGAGLLAPPGDVTAWSDMLQQMTDRTRRLECGAAGRAAVEGEYNWGLVEPAVCALLKATAR